MICHNCGRKNKEGNKFCFGCGAELQTGHKTSKYDFSNEMFKISASVNRLDSENIASSEILEDYENEETVIIDDETAIDVSDYENEETVIFDDMEAFGEKSDITNNDIMKINYRSRDRLETPPPAPTFDYRTVYKEYRTSAEETAYIDHLRRLKELLDDGIITEDEFTRKKQQILGI